jgi:hypothetical protein
MDLLRTRAESLKAAAEEVLAMAPPPEIAYTPISSADAVILYARNFLPSWAGAIAIDLLPAVLVLILAVAQSAIRSGRVQVSSGEALSLAELRDALVALRQADLRLPADDGEATLAPRPDLRPEAPSATVKPIKGGQSA